MAGKAEVQLYNVAEDQGGFITTPQALHLGINRMTLVMMADRGTLERYSRGVYRLMRFPYDQFTQYWAAVLWPLVPGAVLSHETALALFELSDVLPSKVHISIPMDRRVRRTPPAYLIMHRALLAAGDMTIEHGLPVTTPVRTIRDCAACNIGPALHALDDAFAEPYEGFVCSRRPQARALGTHAIRTTVKITYRGQEWATVQLDVTRPDATNIEHERIAAIPLTYFGLTGPVDLPCLSLRYHIAQKWHGLTRQPPSGRPNERFRDAVDLLLLRELAHDLRAVRMACEETFVVCAEQAWPPVLQFPESWRGPFFTLATEVDLPVTDVSLAEEQLQTFLQAILDAA